MSGADDGGKNAAKLMIRAAKQGDVAALQSLLAIDPALVEARDTDGSTPLHCAAWKGHEAAVALLLDHGAAIMTENENDHWGGTPLHAAAHANHRAIAEMLVARGADAAFVSRNGRTPLDETAFHNATAAAKVLRQAIASRAGES